MEDIARLAVVVDSFAYPDGTIAVRDIGLDVRAGEFIGILGSNGSGKTTLLKIMDGLLKDFKGSVALDGTDLRKLSAKEIYRKIGLIFQNPDDQLFAPTVAEDVAFGPLNMGILERDVKARVHKALVDVDMADYLNKSIHSLSFGQKKRACIAGLLSMGHEILLLGPGFIAASPIVTLRPGRVTMPTPAPPRIRIDAAPPTGGTSWPAAIDRKAARTRISMPSVTSGSSPASFTTDAHATPSSSPGQTLSIFSMCLAPSGKGISTSGRVPSHPPTRHRTAAFAAAAAQAPVV